MSLHSPVAMALTQRRYQSPAPRVVGRAGAGLADASWAVNETVATIGRNGELRTATELHRVLLANESGPTVMHDLMLPSQAIKANIDHVVVSGRDVWLLDTKVWAPGVYWTFRGHTRRGLSLKKLSYMDKKTNVLAYRAVSELLEAYNVRAHVHQPVLVVWSSANSRTPSLAWYKPVGARAIAGESLARFCRRMRKPAANDIVSTLARLVVDRSVAAAHTGPALDVPDDWFED